MELKFLMAKYMCTLHWADYRNELFTQVNTLEKY